MGPGAAQRRCPHRPGAGRPFCSRGPRWALPGQQRGRAGPGRCSPGRGGAAPLRPPLAPASRSPALRSFLFRSTDRMTSALPSTSTTMVKISTAARPVAAPAAGPPSSRQPGQLSLLPGRSMRASTRHRRGPSSSSRSGGSSHPRPGPSRGDPAAPVR